DFKFHPLGQTDGTRCQRLNSSSTFDRRPPKGTPVLQRVFIDFPLRQQIYACFPPKVTEVQLLKRWLCRVDAKSGAGLSSSGPELRPRLGNNSSTFRPDVHGGGLYLWRRPLSVE